MLEKMCGPWMRVKRDENGGYLLLYIGIDQSATNPVTLTRKHMMRCVGTNETP